jgi:hypothetical protein
VRVMITFQTESAPGMIIAQRVLSSPKSLTTK